MTDNSSSISSEQFGFAGVMKGLINSTNRLHIQNLLGDYFSVQPTSQAWQGQHFEWFAKRVLRDRFTEIDLAAIGALSVRLPAQTARELIEDHNDTLKGLLGECEMWVDSHGQDLSDSNVSSEWLEEGSSFNRLWDELVKKERVGLGAVKASKLMAAKYPGLVPIFDSQVSWLLGKSEVDSWWKPMRELVIEVKPELDKLTLARDDIHVTTLRKLDVVLWMEARRRINKGEPQL